MELKQEKILKSKYGGLMKKSEFAEKCGGGVNISSITHAMNSGKIDFVRVGSEMLVVLTARTMQYVPNAHPKRTTMQTSQ